MTTQVMIVTGSSRGIGAAIVQVALDKGYRVIGVDVTAPDEYQLSQNALGQFEFVEGDVASESTWEQVVTIAGERFGRIDVLVNNAGISPKREGERIPSKDMPNAEWQQVLDINLTGAFMGAKAVFPLMQAANFGRIINISSQAGREGARVAGIHYGATKTALLGITRTLAAEWGSEGITVNAIAPGRIDTPMAAMVSDDINQQMLKRIPVGRLGTGQDIAHGVLYFASREAGFVTGVTLDINGGSYMT